MSENYNSDNIKNSSITRNKRSSTGSWGLLLENYAKNLNNHNLFFNEFTDQNENFNSLFHRKTKSFSGLNFKRLKDNNESFNANSFDNNNINYKDKKFIEQNKVHIKNFLNNKQNNNSFINFNSSINEKLEKTLNFDSNDLFPYLKFDKNREKEIQFGKFNDNISNINQNKLNLSTNSFNTNLELKKQNSNNFNIPEKEFLINDSSYIIPRNISDLNKFLMFSDENLDNVVNNENNNTLRNISFEKMIFKKSSSNKCLMYKKNHSNSNFNKNYHNIPKSNKNQTEFHLKNKTPKERSPLTSKKDNNQKYDIIEPLENPINQYFQKRHMREVQKLDNLRQERIKKEIEELKDRPTISDNSKKLIIQKFQSDNDNEKYLANINKNVFDRLLEPSQFKRKKEKIKQIEEETYNNISHTPKINEFSKKIKRNLSDLFEWQNKKNEKAEIKFEMAYGKVKKHLFTTKSAKSINKINHNIDKEHNKKKIFQKVFSCKNIKNKKFDFDKFSNSNEEDDKNITNNIKAFQYRKEKIALIDTFDPISTKLTNFNSGHNTKNSEGLNSYVLSRNNDKQSENNTSRFNEENNLRNSVNSRIKYDDNFNNISFKNSEYENKVNSKNEDFSNSKEFTSSVSNIANIPKSSVKPAYLGFKVGSGKIISLERNKESGNLSKNSRDSINKKDIQDSNDFIKERKIDEFYSKLKDQPLLNNCNYMRNDNNILNNPIKIRKETPKKTNMSTSNLSLKPNRNFPDEKMRASQSNKKLSIVSGNNISNYKQFDKIETNNNDNFKKLDTNLTKNNNHLEKNHFAENHFKNNIQNYSNSSPPKKLIHYEKTNNLNINKNNQIISNTIKKEKEILNKKIEHKLHRRTQSQIPLDVNYINSFQTSKLKFKNDEYPNKTDRFVNMNELKMQSNKEISEEMNSEKKEKILETRKYLNEYLSKRAKEVKNNEDQNQSWRKNIEIQMNNS